jgi:ElaB/YqjD/DUF883 family membrane-anchored ribosome-binding protein
MDTTRQTAAEFRNSAGKLAGRVAEDMSDFSEKAKRALGDAGEFAGDVASNAARVGKKSAKFVVKEVREHPLRTLAIGAAVGAVVAAVIMLRNRDDE